ncbi:glutathionylspermidine synthase family protein, partial [Acinetobacter baumannii]
QTLAENNGRWAGPSIYQGFFDIPVHDGHYPIIGSWMVDGVAVGMGVREGGRITANLDRFVPHVIAI